MEEQFTHIATIVFHHDYFENGRFNSLQTGISEDSQKQLFQRLGILIKPITGGVHIFTSKIALLQAQQEAHPISFRIAQY